MKILITDMLHGNGGGHVTYILSLLHGLTDRHTVVVAAPSDGRLYRLASAIPGQRVVPGYYTSRLFQLLREVVQLRRFIRREQFDIVHVNGSADHRHVMLACLGLRHRPVIVWTKHNTRRIDSFGNRLRARLGTDAVIAGCQYVADILKQSFYSRVPITVVRQVIDTDFFQPGNLAEKALRRHQWFGDLAADVLVFGSVAGTDFDKGWILLVEAVARLPARLKSRVRLIVAGDPPSARLRARVEALDMADAVVFPGLVSDVREVMLAADVGFVLSSHEAGSYACCEAMAMGLPVLVTDVGGLPENIQDGVNGWIVPSGGIDEIEVRVRSLLKDCRGLIDMGEAARAWACEQFQIPRFIEGTERVYQQALNPAPQPVHQ